jgi:F-box-like
MERKTLQNVSTSTQTPPEVLTMIFKIMYDHAQQMFSDGWEAVTEKELLSPSLFPYSVSRVCKAWDHAASIHPEFWTRIVIRLDLSKPVEAFKVYLARSKNFLLHSISIVQPNQCSTVPDNFEAEQVTQLVGLIGKRYTRCKALLVRSKFTRSNISYQSASKGTRTGTRVFCSRATVANKGSWP